MRLWYSICGHFLGRGIEAGNGAFGRGVAPQSPPPRCEERGKEDIQVYMTEPWAHPKQEKLPIDGGENVAQDYFQIRRGDGCAHCYGGLGAAGKGSIYF